MAERKAFGSVKKEAIIIETKYSEIVGIGKTQKVVVIKVGILKALKA